MVVTLSIITALLVILIAFLMLALGYFAGQIESLENSLSTERKVLEVVLSKGEKGVDEPQSDPDPANVELFENRS